MLTRNGVCYDFNISPYRVTVDDLTFVFSSQTHKEKFQKQLKTNRDTVNYSLSKRFKFKIDVSPLADVVLYRRIETRGFLIVSKEGNIECLQKLAFNPGRITNRN